KPLVVVGGGDTAMEEATFLTKFATGVTVAHRRDSLRASKIMQEKAFKNKKIDFIWDTSVEEILGTRDGGVTGVRVKNLKTGEERILAKEGVFYGIIQQPRYRLIID